MSVFGIDVSHWQTGLDWSAIDTAGLEYSIAKATDGLSTDPTFDSHRAGAEKAGLIPGAYHYLEPGDGADQADVFASMTNGAHGMLAALDCEAQGLTIGIITDFAERFAKRSGGHTLFIYTGISFWIAHGNPSLKDLGPLWLAYYPKGSGYPGDASPVWDRRIGGVKPTIWQYGPRHIPGRTKPVDGDAFRGARAELEAFTGATQGGPSIGGDPMIGAEGIVVGSSYVVDNIPAGTDYFDGPTGAKIGDILAVSTHDYLGVWGAMLAVEVSSAAAYSDGKARPTIVAIPRGKGTVRAKNPAELAAQAGQYHACPPPATDTTPFDQAYVDAKVAAGREKQHEVDVAAVTAAPTV